MAFALDGAGDKQIELGGSLALERGRFVQTFQVKYRRLTGCRFCMSMMPMKEFKQ